jgi:hypothetical protein
MKKEMMLYTASHSVRGCARLSNRQPENRRYAPKKRVGYQDLSADTAEPIFFTLSFRRFERSFLKNSASSL